MCGTPAPEPAHREHAFANGFGASILTWGPDAHEVAVVGPDGRLAYDTPITRDVIRVDDAGLQDALARIAALTQTPAA